MKLIALRKPMNRRALIGAIALLMPIGTAPPCGWASDGLIRVLVLGDSQAQGLAGGVQRLLRHDRRFRVLDRSKIASGLIARAYDWPAAVRTLAGSEHADVAVVMFGANDRPPVRINGSIDPALSSEFEQSYGARVRDIVQSLREANVPVIWVGHPNARDPKFSDDMALLNRIFAEAAAAAGADYVPAWDLFAGAGGTYDAYGKGVDGETTRLRADDGVHLTAAGYDLLAQHLLPHIEEGVRVRSAQAIPPAVPRPPVEHVRHQSEDPDGPLPLIGPGSEH